MSDSYTKVFRSITTSTICSEPVPTRWLWVVLLSQADSSGCVYGSVPGLARLANITRKDCEIALACFYAPDVDSRTQEHEGRRIESIDGGWRLLNYAKYDAIRGAEERAEYKRNWDRNNRPSGHERAKQSDSPTASPIQSDENPTKPDSPTPVLSSQFPILNSQEKIKNKGAFALVLPEWLLPEVWKDWHEYRNSRKGWTPKARSLSLGTLTKLHDAGIDPRAAVDQSIENGWTGLFLTRSEQPKGSTHAIPRRLSAVEQVAEANRIAEQRERTAGVPGSS